jgi:hypothetical protein
MFDFFRKLRGGPDGGAPVPTPPAMTRPLPTNAVIARVALRRVPAAPLVAAASTLTAPRSALLSS